MQCTNCNAQLTPGDRFCGECGQAAALVCSACQTPLAPEEGFCGQCGAPVAASPAKATNQAPVELFPLYGVTLGQTTVAELAQLGQRATQIDEDTKAPRLYYTIRGTNFWYNEAGIASHIYIARGVYSIPEPWQALGFDWKISYDQWLTLLQRQSWLATVEEPPQVVEYSGHDCFSARVTGTKQRIKITLNFNYNEGRTIDSRNTLYAITVAVL